MNGGNGKNDDYVLSLDSRQLQDSTGDPVPVGQERAWTGHGGHATHFPGAPSGQP